MAERAKRLEETQGLTETTFSSLESAPYLTRKAVKPYAQLQPMPSFLQQQQANQPINLKTF